MSKTASRFYLLMSLFFATGIAWLLFNIYLTNSLFSRHEICVVKNTLGISCPSCGTTRSVMAILNGAVAEAVYFNPLGFLVFGALLIVPCWMLFDLICAKKTLYVFFTTIESSIKSKKIAVFLILLVLLNWIWNIYKHG